VFMSSMLPSYVVGGGAEKSGDDIARLAADVAALGARAADHFFIIKIDSFGGKTVQLLNGSRTAILDAEATLTVARGLATQTAHAGAGEFTIQEFVARPLLLPARPYKHSVRVYALVLALDPMVALVAPTFGHAPFASEAFQHGAQHHSAVCMQIENQIAQSRNRCPAFRKLDFKKPGMRGWEWRADSSDVSLRAFLAMVARSAGAARAATLWADMRRAMEMTLLLATARVEPGVLGRGTFFVCGFDLIVRDDLVVKVLELNIKPGMGYLPNKPRMLQSALALVAGVPPHLLSALAAHKAGNSPSVADATWSELIAHLNGEADPSSPSEWVPLVPATEVDDLERQGRMIAMLRSALGTNSSLTDRLIARELKNRRADAARPVASGGVLALAQTHGGTFVHSSATTSNNGLVSASAWPLSRMPMCVSANTTRCFAEFAFIGNYKCGTTTLSHHLFAHPSIVNWHAQRMGATGSEDQLFRKDRSPTFRDFYLKYAPPYQSSNKDRAPQVVGHYRPSYLQDTEVPHRLQTFFENWRTLKLIVMLRDPVNAKQSGYWFNRRKNTPPQRRTWASRDFDEFAMREVRRTSDFGRCVSTPDAVAAARCGSADRFHELAGFLYFYHLRRWEHMGYGCEQFFVFSLEQYQSDAPGIMQSTFAFLGLEHPGADGTAAEFYSGARRYNPTAKYPEMSNETRAALCSFFAPHVGLLHDYLGGFDLQFPNFRLSEMM